MTTIVYRKDILAGDSFTIKKIGCNSLFPTIIPKIFLSKDKTLAMGYTGSKIPDNKLEFLFDQLKAIISIYENKGNEEVFKDIKFEGYEEPDAGFLIMSKKGLYLYYKHNVTDLSSEEYYCVGSGTYYANTFLLNGYNATETLQKVKLHDILTGGDVYFIKRSSLKKLTMLEG